MWPVSGWKFDPLTSVVTIVIAPLAIYFLFAIRRLAKSLAKYIVDGITYSLSKILTRAAAAALTLARYSRLQLAGPSKFVRVPAIADVSLEIDKIFVPLVLERAGLNEGYDHNTLLNAGNRIRLIGDPGSGKTSIAKKLFRDECRRAIDQWRSRFPILLELRRLVLPHQHAEPRLGDWLYGCIRDEIACLGVYELDRCLETYSDTAGLFVILDGLDEVSSTHYPTVERAINQLSVLLRSRSENNVIALTLRTQFHQQIRENYATEFPVVMSLKRFTPTDIYEFLQRWPFPPDTKMSNVVRIFNDLTDKPTLREMCTNPLVLSMYVAQDQISGAVDIPETRTAFYSRVIEELLIKRRALQVGPTQAPTVYREQRQQILGRIALEHLLDAEQPTNLLSWSSGVQVAADVTGLELPAATSLFRQIANDTGLITEEREGETFRYIHLTFCEFLAAFESVQGRHDGWSVLVDTHRRFQSKSPQRTRLIEVLPFACALMPRHMRDNAISGLTEIQGTHVLALAFLETKLYDHPVWPTFIESFGAALLNFPEPEWDAQWLSELHLYLVVAADADRSAGLIKGIAKSDRLDEFFKDFAAKSPTAISTVIASYAKQDAAAAFRIATLCNVDILESMPDLVADNCDQPPFIGVAFEQAYRDLFQAERWAPLFAEAGLRSQVAADSLIKRTERPWASLAARIPRRLRWDAAPFIRSSVYTDCISIGYRHLHSRSLSMLQLLASIAPPMATFRGRLLSYGAHYGRIGLIIYFAVLVATFLILESSWFGYRPFGIDVQWVVITVFYVMSVALAVLNRACTWHVVIYSRLLNMTPTLTRIWGQRSVSVNDYSTHDIGEMWPTTRWLVGSKLVAQAVDLLEARSIARREARFPGIRSER